VDQIAKPDERVETLGTLCRVHAADLSSAKAAAARLQNAFEISSKRKPAAPLICEMIN